MGRIIRKLGFRAYLLGMRLDGRIMRLWRRKALEIATGRALPGLYIVSDPLTPPLWVDFKYRMLATSK